MCSRKILQKFEQYISCCFSYTCLCCLIYVWCLFITRFKDDNKIVNVPTQFCIESMPNKFHKYLLLRIIYKVFGFVKQAFIELLRFSGSINSIANYSNFLACISLNNQPCMTKPTIINLKPDQYNQGQSIYG